MIRKISLIVTIVIFFTSCIPTKDLVYFQGDSATKNTVHKMLNKPYRLQVNDIIDIRLKAEDEKLVSVFNQTNQQGAQFGNQFDEENLYFTSYSVDRQGNIRIPYIGELNVLGYTEKEVRKKVENELSKFFKNTSDIFITVKLAGIRFTVLGEVANPGTLVLFQNQVSIIEAIANAGDITLTGNRKKVTVMRKSADETKKFTIDLTDVSVFNSESFYVQSNDIIYIEPLKQKSWGTGATGAQTFSTLISVLSLVTTTILLVRNL
ncbi:MAG: polysaccharide biosynthesis/export family protein [Flavobacteriaceae bacterium]|nr:polysaccharide biosynthesis/export family protein [Flavobacteriaceae bacterium]